MLGLQHSDQRASRRNSAQLWRLASAARWGAPRAMSISQLAFQESQAVSKRLRPLSIRTCSMVPYRVAPRHVGHHDREAAERHRVEGHLRRRAEIQAGHEQRRLVGRDRDADNDDGAVVIVVGLDDGGP